MPEMPVHTHDANASPLVGNQPNAVGNVLASPLNQTYRPPDSATSLDPGTIISTGGSQAHLNMQPFLTLNLCIALQGIFPSQN
jgi:microcystin-dependent protein